MNKRFPPDAIRAKHLEIKLSAGDDTDRAIKKFMKLVRASGVLDEATDKLKFRTRREKKRQKHERITRIQLRAEMKEKK